MGLYLSKKKKKRQGPKIDLLIIEGIESKIKKVFKYHIGESNSISSYDLFVRIFNRSPSEMDIFQRIYYWEIIKRILADLRQENSLYVVIKGKKLFVLQSQSELNYVKRRIQAHIRGLQNLETNAEKWVAEKKYEEFLKEESKE